MKPLLGWTCPGPSGIIKLRMNIRRLARIAFFTGWAIAAAGRSFADDSAMNEGAYGPEPRGATKGEESIIRMESEQISVKFGRETSDVIARFVFRSGKAGAPARQLVGFPDIGASYEEGKRRDPKGNAPWQPQENVTGALENLKTFVDGQEVKSDLQYGYIIEDEAVGWKPGTPREGTLMAWHTMWVNFPPDRDVVIERRYRAPNGEMVGGIVMFEYLTVTGAAWRGTIGQMDVDVTLDGWTVDDLAWKTGGSRPQIFETGPWSEPDKPFWKILTPTHLQFTWKDFEPRTQLDRRAFRLITIGKAALVK